MTRQKIIVPLVLLFSFGAAGYAQQKPVQCRAKPVGSWTYVTAADWRREAMVQASNPFEHAIGNPWKNHCNSYGVKVAASVSYGARSPHPVAYGRGNVAAYAPRVAPRAAAAPRVTTGGRGSSNSNKMRIFTSADGKKVRARLLSIDGRKKTAKIATDKGFSYSVPIARFCPTDVNYLKSWWYRRNPPAKRK